MLVRRHHVSSTSSTWEPYAAAFQPLSCRPRILTETSLVSDERTCSLNVVLFPIQVPTELTRTVFPTRDQQVGVRTFFVQEEPPDLQCSTKILAICVAE